MNQQKTQTIIYSSLSKELLAVELSIHEYFKTLLTYLLTEMLKDQAIVLSTCSSSLHQENHATAELCLEQNSIFPL